MKERIKRIFRNYARDMSLLLFVNIFLFFFWASGIKAQPFLLIEDIINAVMQAIQDFLASVAPDPNTIFQQVFGNIVYFFITKWDLEMVFFGLLIGLVTSGDFGETFLNVLSQFIFFIRLAKFQLSYFDYGLLLAAIGVELIPLGMDITFLPLAVTFLIAKQSFFMMLGYFFGGIIAKTTGFSETRTIEGIIARIIALMAAITVLAHILFSSF